MNNQIKISCSNIWKLYGENPEKFLKEVQSFLGNVDKSYAKNYVKIMVPKYLSLICQIMSYNESNIDSIFLVRKLYINLR